ncbi:MAG TPA: TIGR03618 family F420-dependent PPOX class oxidoreductase [Tepidiformaceae bacterium]|nr:TIGR03618 family F420-dependent PPOX class oxidoreductase [Tepidiformaceae bacterium]
MAMNTEQRNAFLRETRIAKVATLNADGSPTIVPVWFEWDGAGARVFTSKNSPKVKRIQADPRAALSVEEPVGIPEAWVTIEGTCSLTREGTRELIARLARRYYDPEKAEKSIKEWLAADIWVTIEIPPKRILSS